MSTKKAKKLQAEKAENLVYQQFRSFIGESVHIRFPCDDMASVSCLFFSKYFVSFSCYKHGHIMNDTDDTVPDTPYEQDRSLKKKS